MANMGQLEILGSELELRYPRPSVDTDYVALMTSAQLREVDVKGSLITLEEPEVYTSKISRREALRCAKRFTSKRCVYGVYQS